MEILYKMRFCSKIENFAKSARIWSQRVPLVLTKKTSTHTLCFWPDKQRSYLEFKVVKSCVMSAIAVERLLTWTNRTRIGVAHLVTALIYNITRCHGKHVAVFAVAVATGDIIKYQSFVYGSFVWEIHVRYNNNPSTKSEGYSFGIVRASVRLSVHSVRPSFRPSVRTFCLAGTISQYLLVRFNSFLVQMISTMVSWYPISLVKIDPLTLELLPLFKYRQL